MAAGDRDGDPPADGGRRVRHGPDDGRFGPQHMADGVQGFAGHDRYEHGVSCEAGISRQGLRGHLRFDGQDYRLGRETGRNFMR